METPRPATTVWAPLLCDCELDELSEPAAEEVADEPESDAEEPDGGEKDESVAVTVTASAVAVVVCSPPSADASVPPQSQRDVGREIRG